jgi:plasmid stabilization system protein ParE
MEGTVAVQVRGVVAMAQPVVDQAQDRAARWNGRMAVDLPSMARRSGFTIDQATHSGVNAMPRGDKDKYTDKQKRKAEHIEQSYEDKGEGKDEAEARAWATVNKQSGGGEKPGGSGSKTPSREKKTARTDSAKRATESRQGHSRTSRASLESQSKESLMKEARSKDLKGRSTMNKAQLVEALHKLG